MGGPTFDINNETVTAAKVGIGIMEPTYKLEVIGDGKFGATGNGVYIGGRQGPSGEFPLSMAVAALNDNLTIVPGLITGTAGLQTTLAYYRGGGGGWTSALEIVNTASGYGNLLLMKSGGNVGIGTTGAPSEKLEVNGNVKVAGKGTFGGETTQGLAIGNGRIFAFADQGAPQRMDIRNGTVHIWGDDPGTNGGVTIRIGGQGTFRIATTDSPQQDRVQVDTAGNLRTQGNIGSLATGRVAIDAQGYCLYG